MIAKIFSARIQFGQSLTAILSAIMVAMNHCPTIFCFASCKGKKLGYHFYLADLPMNEICEFAQKKCDGINVSIIRKAALFIPEDP